MRDESLKFLEKLLNTPSPVGHEARGQRVWMDYAGKFADETFSDAYGNAVAVFNKGGSPRLMLAGHADEIAMVVNFINGDGFIYVRKLGGVDPAITKAQRVTIHTRKGPVRGVVGNVAPHLTKGDPKDRKSPEIHDLFIDIGVASKKEAEAIVRIGDPITLVDEFEMLRGDIAISRAFDNRIGTFAVAETLRLLSESKKKINAEVCAVSNIMEEVGLLGARQIAYSLKPDAAIVVDVTHATDYPGADKKRNDEVALGSGAVLTRGSSANPVVYERLVAAAKSAGIPYTVQGSARATWTDADAMIRAGRGPATGVVSIPTRYMHSPNETIAVKDLDACAQLLAEFIRQIDAGTDFRP